MDPSAVSLEGSRIVIVDDEPRNLALLVRALEAAGFDSLRTTTDSARAVGLCREHPPDLVILDLHMPEPDGYAVMLELAKAFPDERYLPILVLTADITERAKRRALAAGASDFLTKPFCLTEAVLRIRNLLETRALYRELEGQKAELAARVEARTRELEAARLEIVERLAQAVEFRDDVTGRHTRRVGELAASLATAFGLGEGEIDTIRRAAPLHDIGKIAIPDAILRKCGRLSDPEMEMMRQHTTLGARILEGGRTELMATAEAIARNHHERWDGGGYPAGLREDETPLAARIVAVADVFDAVTHPRSYRDAWPAGRAVAEIESGKGRHFDPVLVEAFLDIAAMGSIETTGPESE